MLKEDNATTLRGLYAYRRIVAEFSLLVSKATDIPENALSLTDLRCTNTVQILNVTERVY